MTDAAILRREGDAGAFLVDYEAFPSAAIYRAIINTDTRIILDKVHGAADR